MYTSPMLYKTSSTGKELQWQIKTFPQCMGCSSNGVNWEVLTSHGQVDGKIQDTRFVITSGKNVGKANETTLEEQADAEAISKYKKQLDKGYSEERGGASKEYKPMLAHSYDDHKNKIVFPCFIQPKLDGMRCIAIRQDANITLMSRGGKEIDGLQHIRNDLIKIMKNNDVWDGELYNHDITFQDMMSLVKRDQEDSKNVKYCVYDIISDKSFYDRFVTPCINAYGNVEFVITGICKSHEEVKVFHDDYVRMGYEGAIVRHSECRYKNGGRSNQLLKVKAFFDAEFEIVDVVPAERQPTHGIFLCVMTGTDTTFSATPEGSFELKEQYLRERDTLIGKMAMVRYFELTTSLVPVPRFPIMTGIRENGD
jgi:DNA ligase-1